MFNFLAVRPIKKPEASYDTFSKAIKICYAFYISLKAPASMGQACARQFIWRAATTIARDAITQPLGTSRVGKNAPSTN